MIRLSVEEIIQKINNQEVFEAVAEDYSFTLKIDDYVHFVCGAVHDGHQFRKELWDNCLHTEYDRWFEEDPQTKEMIKTHPIVIAGLDSRFEYDLNRPPESAIYTDAWGKQLWKTPLPEEMKNRSLQKHHNFYRVTNALISKIEEVHGVCIVYDMHSYNWRRWDKEVPTWNLGTLNIDNERFGKVIEQWQQILSEMKLPNNIVSNCNINDTFQGNGYFLKYITKNFRNTLVLATEIKKVYCDELGQVIFPEVVTAVEDYLKTHLKEHAKDFYKQFA
ncbi:MAG: N-formylglutamate amidohydrolase [Flavobacteriaceae bacterium]|nr:N-formylglutamate amidohydrolase [Flavobacteriaceae bacterium]